MDTPTQTKRRTAIYARVSTADQKNGLEAQIRALRLFCEQNKIEDYELFADENQSGTKSSRPGLDRMMKAVESNEIDTVVVFAFSRFARSVSHMLKGLEVFKSHKTNFISLTEKIDLNTSLGHVVFVIISAIAQLERDLIAERVRNGLANAKAKGIRIGRERKRNSVLIESLLDAGLSYREIARIAKCSHGSVHAQKKEYLAKKAAAEKKRQLDLEKSLEQAAEEAARIASVLESKGVEPAPPVGSQKRAIGHYATDRFYFVQSDQNALELVGWSSVRGNSLSCPISSSARNQESVANDLSGLEALTTIPKLLNGFIF